MGVFKQIQIWTPAPAPQHKSDLMIARKRDSVRAPEEIRALPHEQPVHGLEGVRSHLRDETY